MEMYALLNVLTGLQIAVVNMLEPWIWKVDHAGTKKKNSHDHADNSSWH
jgi:hypothetical protein